MRMRELLIKFPDAFLCYFIEFLIRLHAYLFKFPDKHGRAFIKFPEAHARTFN